VWVSCGVEHVCGVTGLCLGPGSCSQLVLLSSLIDCE
jgi:hypothetical protein